MLVIVDILLKLGELRRNDVAPATLSFAIEELRYRCPREVYNDACPTCNNAMEKNKYRYCPCCGQALKWIEIENEIKNAIKAKNFLRKE